MKKEAHLLLTRSLDSLLLSVEHFNRPWDRGREEVVLILLDRAFELLLKATIVHRGGRIREPRSAYTIGFDRCVRKCLSENPVRCLDEEQALTIQIINNLRDAAQHYLLELSEQQLYLYSQSGVTLYDQILSDVFEQKLRDNLPERVLPISTEPPTDLIALFDHEFAQIRELVRPGSRHRLEAQARLRPIAIVEASLRGDRTQPSRSELDRTIRKLQDGIEWTEIFPGIAGLRIDTAGTGLSVSIRLTKREGEAVHLVREGDPGATVVAVRKVNELGFYSMGLKDLGDHVGLTMPRMYSVARALDLQEDPEMYKEFRIGSVVHKRYSQKALERARAELPNIDMEEVWREFRPGRR